jgi:cysteine synthase A
VRYGSLLFSSLAKPRLIALTSCVSVAIDLQCQTISSSLSVCLRHRFYVLLTIDLPGNEALETTRDPLRRGFPVGPSSGLNFRAAQLALERIDNPAAVVVTVFPDRMERYFSTELFARPS